MDPFLPWPGSKAKCAKAILDEFPESFNTYHEPFLGSGALFFAMNSITSRKVFLKARLSDTNKNLIGAWNAVMERPQDVRAMLRHCLLRNGEDFYNAMRTQMQNPAVFLYVMRAGFSSMYRENAKGVFNVPWRKQDFHVKGKPITYDLDRIALCSEYINSKKADIFVADWMVAVQDAKRGDLVYFDPPYIPYTDTGFVQYQGTGFREGDHVFLRTQARLLAERGVFVALSNSDTPTSRRIYGEPSKLINVSNSVKSTSRVKGTRVEGLWIYKPFIGTYKEKDYE